jgi:hypothetical protein
MAEDHIEWVTWNPTPAPNPWARISEIANKVGVRPWQPGDPPSITATGADGLRYDVWAVVAAVLDRLDRQS